MNKLCDARTLAQLLGVKPKTIGRWQRQGRIPCLRAGLRPILFDPDKVLAALEQRGTPKGEHEHE